MDKAEAELNDELTPEETPSAVVMFVDIVDSRLIPARVELLKRHNALVADQVASLAHERGLVAGDDFAVVKFVSDAVMITFNVEQAKAAVDCAKRIMEALQRDGQLSTSDGTHARPRSGIGMSCGKVIPFFHQSTSGQLEDRLGSPIDAAAYLVSVAQAGQVLLDWSSLSGPLEAAGATADLAGAGRVRRLSAKGLPTPIEVEQLLWHPSIEGLEVEDLGRQRVFLQHLLKSADELSAIVSSQAVQFEQPPASDHELSQIGKSCRREFRSRRTNPGHAIPTGRSNTLQAIDAIFVDNVQPEAAAFKKQWEPLAQSLDDFLVRLADAGDELVEATHKDAYQKLAPFQDILESVSEGLKELINEAQRSLWQLMDRHG